MTARRSRLLLYVAGVIAVIAVAAFVLLLHHRRTSADEAERRDRREELARGPDVQVATVEAAPAVRKVTVTGDVRAYRQSTIYARSAGYLDELFVDRGDRVTKGQLLGRITTPDIERQVPPLVANLDVRRKIADRLRPLVPAGVVAQQDLDRAEADVTAARSEVDRLRAVRGFNDIRAPFAGVITTRYVNIGALLPAPTGATEAARPLVDVSDMSRVRIVAYLGQRDASVVHESDEVAIKRDSDPHPSYARVTRIPHELDLRTRTMWVEIEVANDRGWFYPGVFVEVTLSLPAPKGALIPSEAITLVGGKPIVALIERGHARFVPIEVADDDGKTARVVSGLQPGDTIAERIGDEIVDGGPVRPVTPKPAQPGTAPRGSS